MRKCPVKSCGCKIADRMFVCNFHWHRLPPDIRRVISDSYRDYIEEDISHAQLKAVTDQVLADYQGIPVEQVRPDDTRLAIGTCCCGKTLVVTSDPFVALLEDESGDLVVIGGVPLPAAGKAAIYTRFSPHWCPPHEETKRGKPPTPSVRPVCGSVYSPGTHAGVG